jgi:hypothetical protein
MRCLKGSEGRAQGNALGGEAQFAAMVPESPLFHRAGIPIPAHQALFFSQLPSWIPWPMR